MNPQITVTPVFDYDKVDYGKSSDIHLDIILNAPEKESEKRVPLHMILAVDCSGSMSGGKLDSVKSTANKLVQHLTENDTLGMVAFSTNAWEVFPALSMTSANKERALSAISGLQTMMSTNIEEALRMATEMSSTADKKKIRRIVLLTDGLPNVGIDSHEGLVDIVGKMGKSISVSTFGYGIDYNPELLGSMASAGRGNHFYIQNDDDCNQAFALELGGLLSMYGQEIRVSLIPSGNMDVKELMSGYTLEAEGGYRGVGDDEFVFTIDDIYTGEKKHSVLKIGVPKATKAVLARPTRVCDISVEYLDVDTQKKIQVSSHAEIQYVKAVDVPSEANLEVREQLMLLEAARIQKEAKEKADAGDFRGAQVVLDAGASWAASNDWYANSGALAQNFSSLVADYGDSHAYSTVGLKKSVSNMRGFTSSRAASADTVATSYTSDVQIRMMNSFSTGIPGTVEPKSESSAVLNIKDSDGTDKGENDNK